MSKISWLNVGSLSLMKRSDIVVRSSDRPMRGDSSGDRGRLGDIWHLDEVFVKINGEQHYLWRAVDQDGDVIDILVQMRRDQRAAERFFQRLLKSQGKEPFRMVTDKLRTYQAALRIFMPSVTHDTARYTNNRAE